jgi:aminoglycoside phosphotransferase (APT) family kinase protein
MNMFHAAKISIALTAELVQQQFPRWSKLPIRPVELSGHDNRSFRLGDTMLIRLPSAKGYVEQVQKEQLWLPKLAPYLSFQIPKPIAMGKPNQNYPWNWSIYQWIDGYSANTKDIDDSHLEHIAIALAQFLKELHQIDSKDGPPAGPHNYYRGAHPSVYDAAAKADIATLKTIIDADNALAVWNKAIASKWHLPPLWIHGDFASGNILLNNNTITAIIDFGCMGVGDPACDLVIAWTFLNKKSRKIFKEHLDLDANTWARARGWALWKAGFELAGYADKTSVEALQKQQIISEVLDEHNLEYES